ncbi:PH domain-containing protein [Psychroflexus salis]|uniref:YdbS-like PH domain-containing protein n=1 Tax=Psychroflexus salis TaxID=1526574 RepID=A0A916ZT27_9FLAO|nr:PH domain-containing protein [Psychroflexus salis]GGE12527.1 hypothetical protein GCM10010831_12440 [Psychroflexus salis]
MSKQDFSQPQRQSVNGIFLIFFADVAKQFKRFFYALFAPFLSENFRENYSVYLVAGIIVLVILQFIFSYLSYLKYQFQIQQKAFIVQKGVIKRSKVEIPFHRIQNINLQQNILQQVFGVVGFQIETAGESASEIKIKALSQTTAKQLKNALLEDVKDVLDDAKVVADKNQDHHHHKDIESKTSSQSTSTLLHLSFGKLLKVGLSSNYLKGLGLLAVFIGSISNFVNDILSRFIEVDFNEDLVNRLPETLSFIALVAFVLISLVFLLTVSLEVIKYFNLKVVRIKNNFEVEYGLFKKVNQVIKKNKTQVVSFEHNPILRLFKINKVFVSQASASEITEKQKIGLVGITSEQFKEFFEAIFDLNLQQNFVYVHTSFRYMIVLFWRQLPVVLGFGIAGYLLFSIFAAIAFALLILIGFSFLNYKIVKKSFIGLNDDVLQIGSGSIHTKLEYVALHKIQSVQLKRSIFQRRNDHSDLLIYTASGNISISYLPYQESLKLFNFMLYKIESSRLDWI